MIVPDYIILNYPKSFTNMESTSRHKDNTGSKSQNKNYYFAIKVRAFNACSFLSKKQDYISFSEM